MLLNTGFGLLDHYILAKCLFVGLLKVLARTPELGHFESEKQFHAT